MKHTDLVLKDNPSLSDFQNYIAQMVKVRGFDNNTIFEIMLLLQEECGEMAKEIWKIEKKSGDRTSKIRELELEIAAVGSSSKNRSTLLLA